MTKPSWQEFQTRLPDGEREPPADEFDNLAAQVFLTGSGAKFLDMLRHRHFNVGGNALADEASLRVRAANQQMILDIERAVARGMDAQKRK